MEGNLFLFASQDFEHEELHAKGYYSCHAERGSNYGALKTKSDEVVRDCAIRGNDGTIITVTIDNKRYDMYEVGRSLVRFLISIICYDS